MGSPVPLAQGLRSSRGRRCSPLPLIPLQRHGSRPGEAQSKQAACCGWAVTSLGWCPACRVGPRDPATPLGLAGCGEPWRPGLHRSLACGCGTAVRRGLAGSPCPPPPPPLRGCPPAALLCPSPPPPPRGGCSASGAGGDAVMGVPPSAGPRPAARGCGVGAAAMPSWIGGRKAGGGAEVLLLSFQTLQKQPCVV